MYPPFCSDMDPLAKAKKLIQTIYMVVLDMTFPFSMKQCEYGAGLLP
jgi:hypothetical protein